MRIGDAAYGLQYHTELTTQTVGEWGAVPAYAGALDDTLGKGSLPKLGSRGGAQDAGIRPRFPPALRQLHVHPPPAELRSFPARRISRVAGHRLSMPVMLLALGLVGLNLRPAVTSVGPLLAEISQSLGLTGAEARILATLPAVCFGLAGPLAPMLGRRFGAENMIFLAIIALAAGCGMRIFESAPVLYFSCLVAGLAIGTHERAAAGDREMRDFPQRVGAVTGFYTMVLCLGAAGASALAPQVERVFGTAWPSALAVWGLLALVALPAWAPMRARFHSLPQAAAGKARQSLA